MSSIQPSSFNIQDISHSNNQFSIQTVQCHQNCTFLQFSQGIEKIAKVFGSIKDCVKSIELDENLSGRLVELVNRFRELLKFLIDLLPRAKIHVTSLLVIFQLFDFKDLKHRVYIVDQLFSTEKVETSKNLYEQISYLYTKFTDLQKDLKTIIHELQDLVNDLRQKQFCSILFSGFFGFSCIAAIAVPIIFHIFVLPSILFVPLTIKITVGAMSLPFMYKAFNEAKLTHTIETDKNVLDSVSLTVNSISDNVHNLTVSLSGIHQPSLKMHVDSAAIRQNDQTFQRLYSVDQSIANAIFESYLQTLKSFNFNLDTLHITVINTMNSIHNYSIPKPESTFCILS